MLLPREINLTDPSALADQLTRFIIESDLSKGIWHEMKWKNKIVGKLQPRLDSTLTEKKSLSVQVKEKDRKNWFHVSCISVRDIHSFKTWFQILFYFVFQTIYLSLCPWHVFYKHSQGIHWTLFLSPLCEKSTSVKVKAKISLHLNALCFHIEASRTRSANALKRSSLFSLSVLDRKQGAERLFPFI